MIVYVLGFPHCGTTILRNICSKITGLVEDKVEVYTRSSLNETKTITSSDVVCKSPYPVEITNADKRLFILRQPDFVFYSLGKRFKQSPVTFPYHTLEDYQIALNKFKTDSGFTIKYENLFTDKIKLLFEYLEKPYDKSVLEVDQVSSSLSPAYHDHFHDLRREWQIKQSFRNMNISNDHEEDREKMEYLIEDYRNAPSIL